jgi:hypothetical protein
VKKLFLFVFPTLLFLILVPTAVQAAPTAQEQPKCITVALAALSRRGSTYSQGGAMPLDPVDDSGNFLPRLGPNSFDCSGLVHWAYAQAGVTVGLTTHSQQYDGQKIDCTLSDLNGANTTCWQPGDLLFLKSQAGQHVSLYVGDGLVMDCYNHAVGCVLHNPANINYYWQNWWQARRILWECNEQLSSPGEASYIEPYWTVSFEQIPDLLSYVSFNIRRCGSINGSCSDPGAEVWPVRKAAPTVSWLDFGSIIQWLAWALEDMSLDILCWIINLAADVVELIVRLANMAITATNNFWRMLVTAYFGLFQYLFILNSTISQFDYFAQLAAAWLALAAEQLLLILAAIGEIFLALLRLSTVVYRINSWIGNLIFGALQAIITALSGSEIPAALEVDHVFYRMLRGMLLGFRDSIYVGWLFWTMIGWAYITFILRIHKRLVSTEGVDNEKD